MTNIFDIFFVKKTQMVPRVKDNIPLDTQKTVSLDFDED